LFRLLKSEAVLLALKKGLASYLKDRIHFGKIVRILAADPTRRVVVAPAYDDQFFRLPERLGLTDGRMTVPQELEKVARKRDRRHQLRYLVYAIAGMPVRATRQLLRSLTPLAWKRPTPQAVDWARPIAGGFDETFSQAGRAFRWDDSLEDHDEFAPSRWLYVYGLCRFPKDKIDRWRRMVLARGAQFVDTRDLRMPVGFYLSRKLPASWQRLRWCLEGLRRPGLSKLCEVAHTITEAYVEADLFMQYYRPKVYDVRDDYLVGHIVRTIVFNRYGCRTIGLQHGAYTSLGLNPYIAYTYCNTYCAYGPVYFDRIWKGVWFYNERQAVIGVERNDFAYRAMRNGSRRAEFMARYAGKKALLWCPPSLGAPELNRPEMIQDVVQAIAAFQSAHADWVVILNCRRPERASYATMLERLGRSGVLVAEEDFSTYELIAYADAIVVSNSSTVGIEAVCAGRAHVLFVNYWGEWKHPFLRNAKDLAAKLEDWAAGGPGPDPSALEAFRRDFDVGFDGKALERFKNEMRALARIGTS
jgi:hypothetical protein